MNRKFMNSKNEHIKDIVKYINDYMNKEPDYEYKIYIGCDSQVNQKNTIYSVVIGIHKVGHGVHIIHTREREKKMNEDISGIINRLWGEVTRIVETALFLRENGINTDDIGTHVDANGDNHYISNKIYDNALGWLSSLGFDVKGKPEAWAASYAANKFCR